MMVTWLFWLSFWSALLGGPDEPILMPAPLALPRPSATVIDLAAWRQAHRPESSAPTDGRAA